MPIEPPAPVPMPVSVSMVAPSISAIRRATAGTSSASALTRDAGGGAAAAAVVGRLERCSASLFWASRFFRFSADLAMPPTTACSTTIAMKIQTLFTPACYAESSDGMIPSPNRGVGPDGPATKSRPNSRPSRSGDRPSPAAPAKQTRPPSSSSTSSAMA